MNVDAAIPEDRSACTAGFLVRDFTGAVMMSGSCPLGGSVSVLQAELVSILSGLEFANQAGFRRIIVASDCLTAINACNGLASFSDYHGTVLQDIKRLANEFAEIKFVFERRQANESVHYLANPGSKIEILVE